MPNFWCRLVSPGLCPHSVFSKDKLGTMVITGASRGIGAAFAALASTRGYALAVNYRTGEAEAAAVVKTIIACGGGAVAIRGEIEREEDIVRLFETAEQEL